MIVQGYCHRSAGFCNFWKKLYAISENGDLSEKPDVREFVRFWKHSWWVGDLKSLHMSMVTMRVCHDMIHCFKSKKDQNQGWKLVDILIFWILAALESRNQSKFQGKSTNRTSWRQLLAAKVVQAIATSGKQLSWNSPSAAIDHKARLVVCLWIIVIRCEGSQPFSPDQQHGITRQLNALKSAYCTSLFCQILCCCNAGNNNGQPWHLTHTRN